jgi:hypothetical protein
MAPGFCVLPCFIARQASCLARFARKRWRLADNPCHDAAALLIAMAEEIKKMQADAERNRELH